MKFITKKPTLFQLLILLFFIFCLLCILPLSRTIIIALMESIIGRPLQDMTKWNAVIKGTMSFFASLSIFAYFLLYFDSGKTVTKVFIEKSKEIFSSKKSIMQIAILFGIYILCYLTLFRANYDFQDDIKRIISGHKSWVGSSRYISEALSVILHTNFYLNDISPLTQIFATGLLALTSFILAYVLTNGKITKLSLIASTFLGICPFFFENMSYKFDSPYMALAMLFGVLPFLFINDKRAYIVISFLSLIFVCTSYQAANSIYIILSLIITLKDYIEKDQKKECFYFLFRSAACYIFALLVFMLFIMIPTEATIDERETHIRFGFNLFSLVAENFKNYNSTLISNYGNIWIRFFTLITIILFPFALIKESQKSKNHTIIVSASCLLIMYLLSFGAYLVIKNTLISDRAFMGFDVLLASIAVIDTKLFLSSRKYGKIFIFCTISALFYGFLIYDIVRGNLYAKQNDYQKFRFTILMNDMAHVINPHAHNEAYIVGNIGPATSTNMEYRNYKLNFGSVSSGWTHILVKDWNMDLDFLETDSYEEKYNKKTELKSELEAMPLLVTSYYHDIYGENNRYLVKLKNPQVKDYEIK